ncbi:queuosine precursor transporter [Aureimonas fodinaquatilis]|uniref:Probable queuosine precursor transporter n=1 Tax=Aureimonas fodinaquatilis TaxID=2565783 RepID=A0A5B0E2D6_9HYPH|nr:queuosine precursor transporter [Aureimonas fodinaquatilis]KAA0971599.1 queuosine precursor transporter [Aureimonas fodinaquatilis]
MTMTQRYALPVAAMTLIVLASNIAVQFPVQGQVGNLSLGDLLTWGAFVYPFAFIITDINNRLFGPHMARRVVYIGFAMAILSSIVLPPLLFGWGLVPFGLEPGRLVRIALASGSAFLLAQLMDIYVFNRLRRQSWWKAPMASGVVGTILDTLVFFSLAFAPLFLILGPNDGFALEAAPLLGVMSIEAPRWISWAIGDFSVKMAVAVFGLVPYRVAINLLLPYREAQGTSR